MTSQPHADLVALGAQWLKRAGFPIVATELAAAGCRERADVIGFRASCSALIEVKVSRADFLADRKKPERLDPSAGLGLYRFYLTPPDMVAPADLPTGWGLLHAVGGRVERVVGPIGNIWPGPESTLPGWAEFQHTADAGRERSVLFSIARRLTTERRSPDPPDP